MKNKVIAVCGPTAVGKTKYAIDVANALDGEIISCDSMQIYKYMDIGSAKPTKEECEAAVHHLVDEIDPRDEFSVADYQIRAKSYIRDILNRNKVPVIEGGTGLYLNSLIFDMDFGNADKNSELRKQLEKEVEIFGPEYIHRKLSLLEPETAERIHPNNVKKVIRALEGALSGNSIADFSKCIQKTEEYEMILIGLTRDRSKLYDRINLRVDMMVDSGLFDEVERLLSMGLEEADISMKGIGYKEVIGCLEGYYSKEEAVELIKKNTRHLAKRQLTWFRRYDEMKWFDIGEYQNDDELLKDILHYINSRF